MEFSVNTKIIFGAGAIKDIGRIVDEFHVKNVLLCTDQFLLQTVACQTVREQLNKYGIECLAYTDLQPEPIDRDCDRGAEFCREHGIELIIALGGGSVMDQSKAMAAIVTNGKSCRDLDAAVIEKRMLPLVCIPTTAGTGSEVTFVSVITNTKDYYKMTIMDRRNLSPDVALCDPKVLTTLPKTLVASCGIDALTHAIEAYTSKASNPMTDALALAAVKLIGENIRKAWENPADSEAQGGMMMASTMAGCAFINSNVASVHAIAETVGVRYHIPHGIANAIFLPYVMEVNIKGHEERFVELAKQLGILGERDKKTCAEACVSYVRKLTADLEIKRFSDYAEVNPADFGDLAAASERNILSQDNIKKLTAGDYERILIRAYEARERIGEKGETGGRYDVKD